MSKGSTAIGKKKLRKKKSSIKVPVSPDLLDDVLPEDLPLAAYQDFESLDYTNFQLPSLEVLAETNNKFNNEKEPMFPHEVHMTLKNQIQGLEEEKEELKMKLKQAEEKLTLVSPLRNLGRSSDLAANRIVELGKKVKELQAQLKNNSTLKKNLKINPSVNGGGDANEPSAEEDSEHIGTCCGETKAQFEDLTEKYNIATTKLCELRNQNQHLRHEFKLAVKALSSEIGEKVNIQSILSGGQGWRGRAQQILSLQQKVAELTEKLTNYQANADSNEGCRSREKSRIEVESLKTDVETLKTELDTAKSELSETKKKLEDSRARVKSLQAELSAVRTANVAMSDKMLADKKIIDSLNTQMGNLNEKTKGKESIMYSKFESQINILKKDLAQEKQRIEQMQDLIKDKDTKISVLQAKTCLINHSSEKENSESRSTSARSLSLEKDLPPSSSSNSSNEAERARLMELVGVNARRLQEERKTSSTLEEQLRTERHKCVRLETKLARLELERIGWTKGLYKKPQTLEVSYRSDGDWDSLKDKMELLDEKCLALESRIKTLQQEKDDDNRRFIQIIEEQRSSYLELQRKSNQS